jgi:hypothetical protein
METSPDNPLANQLGGGLTEEVIQAAVDKSGYPLQAVVADILRPRFHVQEEWSYVDRDSGELRSLDMVARLALYDHKRGQPRVRPRLSLLIECKQSQQPHVFFLSQSKVWIPEFPVVAGLHDPKIVITSDDDPSSWSYHVHSALGLDRHPFVREATVCNTFSKVVWKKAGEAELSGSDAYNSLVLPLIKALVHFEESQRPPKTAWYHDGELAVALGIIDGPIVTAELVGGLQKLTLRPWVRVLRHEHDPKREHWGRDRLWAIDVLHKDFLSAYLEHHLLPFAGEFATLAIGHQTEIATGKGFARGMGEDSWNDVESRLQPRTLGTPVRRSSSLVRRLWGILTKRSA